MAAPLTALQMKWDASLASQNGSTVVGTASVAPGSKSGTTGSQPADRDSRDGRSPGRADERRRGRRRAPAGHPDILPMS